MTGAAAAERQTDRGGIAKVWLFPSKERQVCDNQEAPTDLTLSSQRRRGHLSGPGVDGRLHVEDLSSMEGPLRVSDRHMERVQERTLYYATY